MSLSWVYAGSRVHLIDATGRIVCSVATQDTAISAANVGAVGAVASHLSVPGDLAVTGALTVGGDAITSAATRYRTVGLTIDGAGAAIAAGVKGSVQVDFAGTIIGWSLQADQSGSISVDVCKKAGTQALPAVPNTTTDKISASAPMALSSVQAKGVAAAGVATWSPVAVAQWDSILFNVTALATSVTRATAWLRIQEA